MYSSLREYVDRLEREGELMRIRVPVSPVEEIAEITDRMSKSTGGGKALLFENTGTDFPVITNLFGSDRRVALALGVDSLDSVANRIDTIVASLSGAHESFADKLRLLPLAAAASRWLPHTARGRGECQQVVLQGEEARLSLLPVLKCWEFDAGRFVTLPMVNTVNPVTGARNVGMYRMQIFSDHTTGMHWHMHKSGARHYDEYRRLGRRMPVAVAIGGDPAYTYSATAPLPDGIDEYLLAGFLRGRPVKLVRCLTVDLCVPSDCDFVIEGYVDPTEEKVIEGAFGDHTGFYSLEDYYPAFHVTAITHRRDAIYPATVVGIPPEEDFYLAKATERIFLAPLRMTVQPEVEDMYMPAAGVAHNLAVVAMRRFYLGQAAKVASSLWGAGQMMFNKILLLAPEGCDIRNEAILSSLLRSVDLRRALFRSEGIFDVLDHSTATCGYGGKIAIDLACANATPIESAVPPKIRLAGGIEAVDQRALEQWSVLILYADAKAEVDMAAFFDANNFDSVNFAVLFDSSASMLSLAELLWLGTGNCDPRRDVAMHGGTMAVDCRTKPAGRVGNPERFPNVVVSSESICSLVDSRWRQYGFDRFVPSPSERYRHLLQSSHAEI